MAGAAGEQQPAAAAAVAEPAAGAEDRQQRHRQQAAPAPEQPWQAPADVVAAWPPLPGRGEDPSPAALAAWQPEVNARGEWLLHTEDLHLLAIGCGLLGCGGGGSPSRALLQALMQLQRCVAPWAGAVSSQGVRCAAAACCVERRVYQRPGCCASTAGRARAACASSRPPLCRTTGSSVMWAAWARRLCLLRRCAREKPCPGWPAACGPVGQAGLRDCRAGGPPELSLHSLALPCPAPAPALPCPALPCPALRSSAAGVGRGRNRGAGGAGHLPARQRRRGSPAGSGHAFRGRRRQRAGAAGGGSRPGSARSGCRPHGARLPRGAGAFLLTPFTGATTSMCWLGASIGQASRFPEVQVRRLRNVPAGGAGQGASPAVPAGLLCWLKLGALPLL